jgi:hypothetical protein
MRAKHYCADCNFHFRADPEVHAEVYHDNGLFRGIVDGDYRDYYRKTTR